MTFRDQFLSQFAVVINLAITDQGDRAVLIEKGLVAPGQVDDLQSGMTEAASIE